MPKKKEAAPEAETTPVESTEQVEIPEDGIGISDPEEVMKRLANEELEAEDNAEEVAEEPEELKEEETPPEETPETKAEEEPKEQEPSEVEKELETWKKRYADSQREVQTKYLPLEKELENLKKDKDALAKERQEIAEVLRSDPDLLDSFVRAANNPDLVETAPAKLQLDKETLEEAFREAFGQDALEAIKDAKNVRVQARLDAIDKFEAEHPGLTDEERVKLAQVAGSLETIDKIDLKSALDRSYVALYPDKAFEKKSKEIEETAKINALKNKESTMARTSSSSSSNPQARLTPQEQLTARKLQMSEEEYLNYKLKA